MIELRTRIAAALDQHKTDPYDEWTCQCGSSGTRWADHVADAVIRELALRRVTDVNRSVPQSRYVTEWETDDV